jgi:hypothetical protein
MNNELHEVFQQAIKVHLPDDNWRLVEWKKPNQLKKMPKP